METRQELSAELFSLAVSSPVFRANVPEVAAGSWRPDWDLGYPREARAAGRGARCALARRLDMPDLGPFE